MVSLVKVRGERKASSFGVTGENLGALFRRVTSEYDPSWTGQVFSDYL